MCSCLNLCKNIIKNYLHNTIHFKSIVYFHNCSLQLTLKITSFDNFQFTKLIEKYLLLFQYYKYECCSAYHTSIFSVYELVYSGLQLVIDRTRASSETSRTEFSAVFVRKFGRSSAEVRPNRTAQSLVKEFVLCCGGGGQILCRSFLNMKCTFQLVGGTSLLVINR